VDEKDPLGGGVPLSETGLSPKWQSLIRRLWEPDGKSIIGFLPEIVATVKYTKRSTMAEHGLLMVLHSPKVKNDELELEGPVNVRPGHQVMKFYCDAAGLPHGKVRDAASALISAVSKKALTEAQIMAILQESRGRPTALDPERPFAAGPMNRRSAPESGRRRYGSLAPEATVPEPIANASVRPLLFFELR
jgi:hypothetical protein